MLHYDPQRHHRRSIRLKGYDYTLAGAYYVTMCVQGGMPLLCDVTAEGLVLSAAGQMVQTTWDEIPQHYPGVDVDAFMVMPNHVHGIVVLTGLGMQGQEGAHGGAPQHRVVSGRTPVSDLPPTLDPCVRPDPSAPGSISLAEVVQRWKTLTTTRYGIGVRGEGWPPYAGRLWQRDYYEHIIRNEREMNAIRAYIEMNPVQWQADRENPANR